MSSVTPVEKEVTVRRGISEVKLTIIKQLETMNGEIVKSDRDYIECDFGSLAKSRIIGEFWVSKATLPKKVKINLESVSSNDTKVKILVIDTHKYGVKWGYVKKYEEALLEVTTPIIRAIE